MRSDLNRKPGVGASRTPRRALGEISLGSEHLSDQPIPPTQQQKIDFAKWSDETKRREAERAHDKVDEFHSSVNEAAIKSAELTLRMSLLINGGAAVSLLTFIGPLPKDQKIAMANTLIWFASGVGIAVAALAFSYLTHYFTAAIASSRIRIWQHPYLLAGSRTSRWIVLTRFFHIAAIVLAIASLAAFVGGMVEVRSAFAH